MANDALERACRRMIDTHVKLNEVSFLAAMAGCAQNACKDHVAADRIGRGLAAMDNDSRRRAVELREEGYEYSEIGDALAVSVDNAYQLVSRGKRDLRELMEP